MASNNNSSSTNTPLLTSPVDNKVAKDSAPWGGYALTMVLQLMAVALAMYCAQYIALPTLLSHSLALIVSVLLFRGSHLKMLQYLLQRGRIRSTPSPTDVQIKKTKNAKNEVNSVNNDYISFSQMVSLGSMTMLTLLASSWALSPVLQDIIAYPIFTLMTAVCLFGPQYHKFLTQLYHAIVNGESLFPSDMLEVDRQFFTQQVQAEVRILSPSELPPDARDIVPEPRIPVIAPNLPVKVQWDYNEIQAKVQAANALASNKHLRK